MPKFNGDRIIRLISELTTALQNLKELAQLSEDAFLADRHKIGSAKYNFVVAIEAIIDMCNHIISKNRFRTPEDYADTFTVMFENGVFDLDLTETLKKMARFRNRLIHIYWEVNNQELHRIMRENLDDFEKFLIAIKEYLGL
ncbi:MAG: type VII toxin-antitoxin system HepT family RNase toxin [bacterium]